MKMTPTPTSSQIEALGHEGDVLQANFKGGSRYQYQNVTEKLYKEIMSAKSIGKAFAEKIKSHPTLFPYKKLGENGATAQSELTVANPLVLTGDGWEITATKEAEKQKKELIVSSSKIKVVNSGGSSEVARGVLRNLAVFRQTLEKTRKAVKEPILELGRKIDARAKEFGEDVDREEQRVSGLISDYAREQEMKRREAEMEAKRLLEESERREREAEEARIAQEAAEMQRFLELEDGRKKQAEAARLEALKQQRAAEQAEREEEEARKAAFRSSMQAMAEPVKGTKAVLDFEVESVEKLYEAWPSLVTLTPKRREILEFIRLQQERNLPVGLPGIKVIEVVKVSSR